MPSVQVRRFHRADRDQVTALVNAHIAAVVPNVSVSVQTMMSQLEREPGEFVVDPWVRERRTLVAEQRGRVVAAAHLLRYRDDEDVGPDYRDAGEIRWLLCWPPADFWSDATDAGYALAASCLAELNRWQVRTRSADGTLPAPGVYGVPEQWPHVRELYRRIGFVHPVKSEDVYLARVGDIPRPRHDWEPVRSLGVNGTRITATAADRVLGYVEVDTNMGDAARTSRTGGLADVGNLHVFDGELGDVGGWLLGQAAGWLDLGEVTRLLAYVEPDDAGTAVLLRQASFVHLTRTVRGLSDQS